MEPLKIGIVGLGWVADVHIHAFNQIKGCQVVAVYSKNPLEEAELEQVYGYPIKIYRDYQTMLAEADLDVIDICTPNHQHYQQALQAIHAKKHLILEKPICLTYSEMKTLKQAVEEAGIQVCVGFECRFTDHFTMVRAILDQGLIGELHYAEVDYYHGVGPWIPQYHWNIKKECGGSSLLTAGCHAIDALLFFVDDGVDFVQSQTTHSHSPNFESYEYPTTSLTTLRFSDTPLLAKVTSCIDCLQPYYFHLHLVGSEGTILDNKFYSAKLPGMHKHKWSTLETSFIDSKTASNHPYKNQFRAFFESLQRNEAMPLTDFHTAFESHRVVFAADLSAEENRRVNLSEFD